MGLKHSFLAAVAALACLALVAPLAQANDGTPHAFSVKVRKVFHQVGRTFTPYTSEYWDGGYGIGFEWPDGTEDSAVLLDFRDCATGATLGSVDLEPGTTGASFIEVPTTSMCVKVFVKLVPVFGGGIVKMTHKNRLVIRDA